MIENKSVKPIADEQWLKFKSGDGDRETLRNQLVERYLPLVKYNAERIWARLPDGVELGDLIQAGAFGLMDAIQAFDLQRGVKFETYCVPRIKGAMLDQLRALDWIPRLVRSKAHKLDDARKSVEARHGRPATDEEMAEKLELPMPEYEKMVRDASAYSIVSLSKKWYETDSYKDVREIDVLEDKKGENPIENIQRTDVMDMVTRGLSKNERLIILLYYYEEMTMKEIGATLDLSESRVSQMHSGILSRLQGQLRQRRTEFDDDE
jgi:RNA polymerase sigma factor FliA